MRPDARPSKSGSRARAQFVFGTCAAGAVVLTVNVVLLGGNIGFFQSMCLLGYCLFPMDLAAIVTAFTTNMIARWIVVLVGFLGWTALSLHSHCSLNASQCMGLPNGLLACMHETAKQFACVNCHILAAASPDLWHQGLASSQ